MTFFGSLCFVAFIASQLHVAGAAVGTACTATGTECGTSKGFYCDTTTGQLKCKCAKIYTGADAATACTDTTCSADSTCTNLDANGACSSGNCACKTGYELTTAAFAGEKKCTVTPITVGKTCTAAGSECGTEKGFYCDTTTGQLKCKCAKIYTGATGVTSCTDTSCTTDATCTDLDSNSVCTSSKCACATNYEHTTTAFTGDKKCTAKSGVSGLVTSVTLLITGLALAMIP